MGMKIRMGYVSPATIEAQRKATQAKREAAKRAIDQRVSEGLATLVDAAVAKVKGEPKAPEIEEPKEKAPPPFGLNRPGCSKDFAYKLSDGKNTIDKVITVSTGDRVPMKHHSAYWESKKLFGEILKGFALQKSSPIGFYLASSERDDVVGFGNFSPAFLADDPSYLARDLAHVNAILAARGLSLVFDPFDFNRDPSGNLIYDPSEAVAESACATSPTFNAERLTVVQWHDRTTDTDACTVLRPGDHISDHLHRYFHAKKETYEKILRGYKAAAALSFASSTAGRGANFSRGYLKDYLNSIIPDMKAQPLDFFVYDSNLELRADAAVTHYASSGPNRTFFAASTAYGGNRFGCVGHGWVPEDITAEQLAHIDCRFAANGLEIRLVPRVEDNLPTNVIDLMWGRA